MNTNAKFQVLTESFTIVATSDTRKGINNFLDRFADGTDNAEYEVIKASTDADGTCFYTVRQN